MALSGRVVLLVGVRTGKVYTVTSSSSSWWPALNSTGSNLATTGPVRSAAAYGKLFFADGTSTLYYQPSTNEVKTWTPTAGSLPGSTGHRSRLICLWRGRIVLSGVDTDGHNWFMTKVGDPFNLDYFPTEPSSVQAVCGNNSVLGLIGDVVTALVPYSDDVLYVGCDHTLWRFQGDPMAGGQIDRISDEMGMAFGSPWAKDPYGNLYFFSNKTGIYVMQPGQPPIRISQQIEQLLYAIDTGSNVIRMLWNDRWQGLHLFCTPTAGGTGTHFFWEQRVGAWWVDTFGNDDHDPICCTTWDGDAPEDRYPLIGSSDGYVRSSTPAATDDDGTAIASSVLLGPLAAPSLDDLLLKDLQGVLGDGSDSVGWSVQSAKTVELASAADPYLSGVWQEGVSYNTPVRFTSRAHWVKLESNGVWAMELVKARLQTQGKVLGRDG